MKTESLKYEKAAQKCRPFNVFNQELSNPIPRAISGF